MYTIQKKKTNAYHILERKGQSTMTSALPIKAKFQDFESQELRKYQQHLKIGWRQSLVPSLPSRNKTLVIAAKHYEETDIKMFLYFPFLRDFFTVPHY